MGVSPPSSVIKQILKIFNPMAINVQRISLIHEKLHFLHFSVRGERENVFVVIWGFRSDNHTHFLKFFSVLATFRLAASCFANFWH